MQGYEGLGQAPDRDPRATSLKFMYAAPASVKDKKATVGLLAVPAAPALDENGDDEAVRAFKAKLYHKDVPVLCPSSSSVPMGAAADGGVDDEVEDLGVGRVYPQRTELEKLSGISARPLLTAAELAQRHPVLRNAPTEGSYTHGLSLQHKPFNDPIRNVRCLRCGLWGHVSGDRECKQKDLNPRDRDRLVREDPMKGQLERDEDSSDPEGAFLATLTRREKKLLLRKLQRLEGGEAEAGAGEERKKSKKSKHRKKESKHDKEHKSKRPRKAASADSSSSSSGSSSD